jgi:hypothetical protein
VLDIAVVRLLVVLERDTAIITDFNRRRIILVVVEEEEITVQYPVE